MAVGPHGAHIIQPAVYNHIRSGHGTHLGGGVPPGADTDLHPLRVCDSYDHAFTSDPMPLYSRASSIVGMGLPPYTSVAVIAPLSSTVILNFLVLSEVDDLTIKPETGGRNFSSSFLISPVLPSHVIIGSGGWSVSLAGGTKFATLDTKLDSVLYKYIPLLGSTIPPKSILSVSAINQY